MNAEDFARAVREEEMDFDDALIEFLFGLLDERLDVTLYMALKIAIGYAAMGCPDEVLDLPGGNMTVAQAIEEFGLGPFVEKQA